MNIIEKRIDDLIMYENNPKIHTDEQIDKIAKSIELTKGLRQPIVIDKNNVIVVGHGRVQAAMQLGLETVPYLLRTSMYKLRLSRTHGHICRVYT